LGVNWDRFRARRCLWRDRMPYYSKRKPSERVLPGRSGQLRCFSPRKCFGRYGCAWEKSEDLSSVMRPIFMRPMRSTSNGPHYRQVLSNTCHTMTIVADREASKSMSFAYHYPEELKKRGSFPSETNRQVAKFAQISLRSVTTTSTMPMSAAPAGSVTIRRPACWKKNRASLNVVDASIFPSSDGINPSLTIAANALRKRLG
jgi:GMC oxidoreductase